MHPVIALALRRTLILAGATGSAMVAHTLVSGQLLVTPLTPVWWGMLTSVAMLAGPRTGWSPRGFGRTLGLLALLQGVVHFLMGSAPWLFGLGIHHEAAMVSPAMLFAHVLALTFSAWLIARAELIIDRALAAAAFVKRALEERPSRRSGHPDSVRLPHWAPLTRIAHSPRSSRAPPALTSI